LQSSRILETLPAIEVDTVYCDKSVLADAVKWKQKNAETLLGLK
jgi:hypothetical protein